MGDSYIKLLRKLLDWEWYSDSKMVHIFIHLLLRANFVKGKFQGHEVDRGQLICGYKKLNKDTGISTQSLRTCLNRLISTGEITIKTTNKFSIITIVKYEDYQSFEIKSTRKTTIKLTNEQQTTNIQSTTIKESKEGNKENIDSRKLKFASTLEPFLDKYGRELLNAFYSYWVEPNKSKTKFRQELEKTWELERRLQTWASNDSNFKKTPIHSKIPNAIL